MAEVAAGVGLNLAGSIGLGLIGGRRRAEQRTLTFDEQPTSLATRGTAAPVLIGRRRVAPIFLWAGDRRTRAGAKQGKGGGGSSRETIYIESAWQALCAGPVDALDAIYVDNKPIYEGPLVSGMASSGDSITLTGEHPGSAHFYFGELTQPVNPRLAEGDGSGNSTGVGVASAWPGLCYIEHRGFEMGTSPTWPNLEIELLRVPVAPIDSAPPWIAESEEGARDDGVNAAHALWSLMHCPPPLGAGMHWDRSLCACWNAAAEACAAERLAVNFLASGGIEASRVVSELLVDMGCLIPEFAGRIAARLVRGSDPEASLPVISVGVRSAREERERQHAPLAANRASFTFPDRALNYRDAPLRRDDDVAAAGVERIAAQRVRIPTATSEAVASTIADRRAPEILAPVEPVAIMAGRAAALLLPGDLVVDDRDDRVYVVDSARRSPGEPAARLSLTVMRFGSAAATSGVPGTPKPPPVAPSAADTLFVPVEIPRGLQDDETLRIGVLRIRSGSGVIGADVLASQSATGFQRIGSNDGHCFGGELDAQWTPGRTVEGEGPVIEAFGDDIAEAEDLAPESLRNDWLSGRQPALVGTGQEAEVIWVRWIEPLGGGMHRLHGVVRARLDTDARTWPAGTPIVFFGARNSGRVSPLAAPAILQPGVEAHIKSVPSGVDASEIDAEQLELVGRAASPLPVDNVKANGQRDGLATYGSAEDITVTWTYRVRDGIGSAAGEQRAGVAIGPQPGREGPFEVEIWAGSELKRTLNLDSDDTREGGVTYTNADNVADGGPHAEIEARIYHRRGARRSRARTITITLE